MAGNVLFAAGKATVNMVVTCTPRVRHAKAITPSRTRRDLPRNRFEEACMHFTVTAAQLGSASRMGRLVAARTWVANEALSGRVASVAEVARLFNRDESSIRRSMRKLLAVA